MRNLDLQEILFLAQHPAPDARRFPGTKDPLLGL
jgi:hypothetical protein